MFIRHLAAAAMFAALLITPASARIWHPTPKQTSDDYATIVDDRSVGERISLTWSSGLISPDPTAQQLLNKYVVISIAHIRQDNNVVTYDDVLGVTASDGSGTPLKEVPQDIIAPGLIGMMATSDAILRQRTQGRGKLHWDVYEAGPITSCGPGKLQVNYDGETYTWDTPMPGCPKP